MKKLLIIGGMVFLVGIFILLSSLSVLNWNIAEISSNPILEKKEKILTVQDKNITVEDKNMPYVITKSPDEDIHLKYFESQKENYDIKSDGDITITKTTHYRWYDLIFNVNFQNSVFTIQLPENFSGSLKITTNNGSIKVQNIKVDTLTCSTNNGKVTMENLRLNGDVTASTETAQFLQAISAPIRIAVLKLRTEKSQ